MGECGLLGGDLFLTASVSPSPQGCSGSSLVRSRMVNMGKELFTDKYKTISALDLPIDV